MLGYCWNTGNPSEIRFKLKSGKMIFCSVVQLFRHFAQNTAVFMSRSIQKLNRLTNGKRCCEQHEILWDLIQNNLNIDCIFLTMKPGISWAFMWFQGLTFSKIAVSFEYNEIVVNHINKVNYTRGPLFDYFICLIAFSHVDRTSTMMMTSWHGARSTLLPLCERIHDVLVLSL